MKKNWMLTIISISLFLVVGCASTGNRVLKEETSDSVSEKIVKGETTQEEVKMMYGDPMTTRFTDSGNQVWHYEFVKSHAKATSFIPVVNMFSAGAEGDKKELVVFFDSAGIVRNYSMSTSKVETNTGFIQ